MALTEELRMSILQFALQGRLTEQLADDSSVDDLFERIQEKKQALITSGTIKKEKKLPQLDDETLFDIPQNWRWARMQHFLDVRDGTHDSPKYHAQGVPFVTSKNISKGFLDFADVNFISQEDADKINQRSLVEENDILLAMIGSIGNPVKVHKDRDFAIKNMALIKSVPDSNINMDYVLILLQYMQAVMKRDSSGGVQKFVSLSYLREFPVPVPPIEEQQRIVDRVNIIMAKLDEFSVIEQQLITLKTNFPADMRGAILQAAMQGKLTEQLVSDSSVTVALEKANSEKELLLLKKGTKYPAITDEEIPYDLPDNWQWVRLRSIVYNREQKTPTDTFSYIDIGSIDNAHQQLNSTETIIEASAAPSRARKIVKFGDVIYATVRPYLHNLCIIDREFSHEPIASTGFAAMVCHSCILNRYLLHYLMSPTWDKYANATDNAKGVAYPAINDKKLYAGLIPLPPIEEQKRIVERLDTLLPLCDTLME